jgi:hypothetical protein
MSVKKAARERQSQKNDKKQALQMTKAHEDRVWKAPLPLVYRLAMAFQRSRYRRY